MEPGRRHRFPVAWALARLAGKALSAAKGRSNRENRSARNPMQRRCADRAFSPFRRVDEFRYHPRGGLRASANRRPSSGQRSAFVNASLLQLQAAAQLPSGGISETATNAALALIEAAAPRNEVEGALAVQMACTHVAAMSVLARFRGGGGTEHRVVALATAAARLLRAYSVQVETLRRLRHGGDQYVRVEHVHVNDGGQAIVGNVKTAGSGAAGAPEQSASGVIAPAPSGHRH